MTALDDELLDTLHRKCGAHAVFSHPPADPTGADPCLLRQTGVCGIPGVECSQILCPHRPDWNSTGPDLPLLRWEHISSDQERERFRPKKQPLADFDPSDVCGLRVFKELLDLGAVEPEASEPIPNSEPPPTPREQGRVVASLEVPVARSGTVRYPKGEAALKKAADPDSESVASVRNGTPVAVDQILGDWYAVTVGRQTGYMHYTWVRVDQFDEDAGDRRYVQVKSLSSLPAAESFIKSSPVSLVAHLTAKNWFAITLTDTYAEREAKDVANALKAHGLIAKDSIVTLGNTYVRKVCCD